MSPGSGACVMGISQYTFCCLTPSGKLLPCFLRIYAIANQLMSEQMTKKRFLSVRTARTIGYGMVLSSVRLSVCDTVHSG